MKDVMSYSTILQGDSSLSSSESSATWVRRLALFIFRTSAPLALAFVVQDEGAEPASRGGKPRLPRATLELLLLFRPTVRIFCIILLLFQIVSVRHITIMPRT